MHRWMIFWTALLVGCGSGGSGDDRPIVLELRASPGLVRANEEFSLEIVARQGNAVVDDFSGRVRFECDQVAAETPTAVEFTAADRGRKTVPGFRVPEAGAIRLRAIEHFGQGEGSLTFEIQPATAEPPAEPEPEPEWGFRLVTDPDLLLEGKRTFVVTTGDFDGDGDVDVFASIEVTGEKVLLRNDGLGNFSESVILRSATWQDCCVGDLDSDGDLDILGTSERFDAAWVYQAELLRNDGSGQFELVTDLGIDAERCALGDVDRDGRLDVVAISQDRLLVYRNRPGLRFERVQQEQIPGSRRLDLGDLNGDGRVDLVVGTLAANPVYLNEGGVFVDTTQRLGRSLTTVVRIVDLDQDGSNDVFIGNAPLETVKDRSRNWVYRNFDGAGALTLHGKNVGMNCTIVAAILDLDGDGDLDVINGTITEANDYWENDGSGLFQEVRPESEAAFSRDLDVADIDGDGTAEILRATFGPPDTTTNNPATWEPGIEIVRIERFRKPVDPE
ncbi:MAG: VCBS repeat-containing protein [Planctomycetota bacterium]